MLEPDQRYVSGVLGLLDLLAAPFLVLLQRSLNRRGALHGVGQCNRVFHRKLGAGTDREMRGRLGISQQHHIVLDPSLAADHRKITPHRAIDQERMPFEEPAENLSHPIGRLLLAQALKPRALESLGIGLEDPGRAPDLVLIGVRDERTPFGFLKDKREGIERPGRAHPGEHIGAEVHLGLEVLDILFAEAAVDAVGQHHQIGIGEARLVFDVGLEQQRDAEFARPLLQDQEQRAARAAAEAVAADPVHRAAKVHGDIVPIGELAG